MADRLTPAKKFVGLGASWKGLLGGKERGARALFIARNGAQFGAVNRSESNREENGRLTVPCVIHVRELEDEDDVIADIIDLFLFLFSVFLCNF